MAEKLPDLYYVRVSAKAKIGGTEYPLRGFDVTYELDEVPKATLEIALGRGMSGPGKNKVSSGHGMLESIKPFTPVEISVNLKADPPGRFTSSKDDSGLKDGEDQVIFTGFLFTPEQTKDRVGVSAAMTFRALGYPAALGGSTQFGTGLINVWSDSGPGKLIARLGTGVEPKGKGGDGKAEGATLSSIDAFLLEKSQPKKILNRFILLLFQRFLNLTSSFNKDSSNLSARAALNRMIGSPLGVPDLELDYGRIKSKYYDRALCRYYVRNAFEPWRNPLTGGDLWSALRALANQALFKIVPAINHDAMAPVTYGLGGEAWRSFEPSDYWTIQMLPDQFTPEFYSYVWKVGVSMPAANYSHYQNEYQIGKVLGYSQLPLGILVEAPVEGKLITVPPPDFLICPGPPGSDSGLGGATVPDAADPTTNYAETNFGDELNVWVKLAMGNGYASAVLRDRMFEHRKCEITGRFRLDIAPGSLVKIKTIGERFVSESEELYGHATRVYLRGEPGRMETTVRVTAVRTQAEHDRFTVDRHPLFERRWVGAMLTD